MPRTLISSRALESKMKACDLFAHALRTRRRTMRRCKRGYGALHSPNIENNSQISITSSDASNLYE
jgi:hypothetical protein